MQQEDKLNDLGDEKMKVAMIGHKVVPSRRGGIENVLTTLCPILTNLGLDITCYNRSTEEVENEYIGTVVDKKYHNVTLKKAFTIKGRGLSAMIASFTAAACATFANYDIIHFHAEGPCAAMWIPKMFGKRCVATVHGLDWQREKWGSSFASKYIKFGEKVMVKYADEIIVLSESAKAYFKETYNRETVLIHNGINKPTIRQANKITELYGLSKGEYICTVSRLTAEKGIHYLIDAYNNIKTHKKLVIAGDTSDTDEYVSLLKQKAKDNPNIIFTGFISGEVLEEIFSNAYIVAVPSDIEGMSISLLEALSYGNAVLSSNIPENTVVTEDKAILFEKSNIEDLREKLQMMCDDEEIVQNIKKGVDEFVLLKYNWQDVAASTHNLYKKVMENSTKGRS